MEEGNKHSKELTEATVRCVANSYQVQQMIPGYYVEGGCR